MKRLHVNLAVTNIEESIRFYTALFSAEPSVEKSDYAKWMLDDPRVNFAISNRSGNKGVDHLGIQVENDEELSDVYARLKTAGGPTIEEGETTCCYANSEKTWIFDPEGIAWETFLTHGESPVYGSDQVVSKDTASNCCTPSMADQPENQSNCC